MGLESDELERRQAMQEADVAQVVARKERDRQRLASGQVSSPREMQNLQGEIEALQRRQGVLEDAEIEVMEALEATQARQDELHAELAAMADRGRAAQATRDATWAQIDAESAEATGARDALAASLPADLVTHYEKLRAQLGGVGAAALRRRQCQGCRLQVDPADARRFAAAPADEVLHCEECRRILVRTAESGL